MHIISMSLLVDEKKFSISVMSQFESGGRQTKPGWSPLSLPPCRPYTSDSPRLRISFLQIWEILTFKTAFIWQFIIYMLNLWQSCFKDLSTFGPIVLQGIRVKILFLKLFEGSIFFCNHASNQLAVPVWMNFNTIQTKSCSRRGRLHVSQIRSIAFKVKLPVHWFRWESCGPKQWLNWP